MFIEDPVIPQNQGAYEVSHKEKIIYYTKYLEDKDNFNLNEA